MQWYILWWTYDDVVVRVGERAILVRPLQYRPRRAGPIVSIFGLSRMRLSTEPTASAQQRSSRMGRLYDPALGRAIDGSMASLGMLRSFP